MQATLSETPVFDADLFSPEALRAPYPHYRRLRDLGPLARLAEPDVYVLSRFDVVHDALRASDVLVSGQGVGFSPAFNQWGGPNLLASDGDMHQRMKTEVLRPLLPGQLRKQRPFLKEMIASRIDALVDAGPFEAMEQIARVLPTMAISALVGLPEEGAGADAGLGRRDLQRDRPTTGGVCRRRGPAWRGAGLHGRPDPRHRPGRQLGSRVVRRDGRGTAKRGGGERGPQRLRDSEPGLRGWRDT